MMMCSSKVMVIRMEKRRKIEEMLRKNHQHVVPDWKLKWNERENQYDPQILAQVTSKYWLHQLIWRTEEEE